MVYNQIMVKVGRFIFVYIFSLYIKHHIDLNAQNGQIIDLIRIQAAIRVFSESARARSYFNSIGLLKL